MDKAQKHRENIVPCDGRFLHIGWKSNEDGNRKGAGNNERHDEGAEHPVVHFEQGPQDTEQPEWIAQYIRHNPHRPDGKHIDGQPGLDTAQVPVAGGDVDHLDANDNENVQEAPGYRKRNRSFVLDFVCLSRRCHFFPPIKGESTLWRMGRL